MTECTAIKKTTPTNVVLRDDHNARRSAWSYRPSVDIIDQPESIEVLADIPGAQGEDIEIAHEAGVLTIQAEVRPRSREGTRAVTQEYGVGNFHRRFEIDSSVEVDAIAAEYNHGVLRITLPKAQQARRHRIPVTVQ